MPNTFRDAVQMPSICPAFYLIYRWRSFRLSWMSLSLPAAGAIIKMNKDPRWYLSTFSTPAASTKQPTITGRLNAFTAKPAKS
jgi:hypothetical protein